MIRLGGLVSQKAFGKFEMGKVISNPFAKAFVNEAEGEDHEVSMANNSIDTIIKMATELKAKMGEDEKQIPAWIQDHIAKAENYISQASGNYHEYGDSNESVVNETPNKLKHTISKKEWSKIPKYNKHIGMDGVHYIMKYDDKIGTYLQGVQIVDESVNEAPIPVKDGKYHFYYKDGVGYLTYGGKEISSGDYDMEDGSNAYWMSHSSFKGSQKAFKTGKDVVNYFKSKKITTESVNEAPTPSTGEKIQNLNNRIKALKDKMAATKSSEQKNLIQQRLKNALQTLSNYKKQNISKESVVNEVSVSKLHKDHTKVVEMIQQHLEKYKSSKGTPQAEKHVSELKKLNAVKKKIEADLDSAISGLYKDAELKQD